MPADRDVPTLESALDPPTAVLVGLAAAMAVGHEHQMRERCRTARAVRVEPVWVDELLLQTVLMVGWPRALVAAQVWRQESGVAAPASDPSLNEAPEAWRHRGEATCAVVYGPNYERLRENVRALHPALDAWMVTEGYGRVLSRPGLDLMRRELCTVAQVAVLGAERQLHSHLRGALHAGATRVQVDAVLTLVEPDLSPAAQDITRRTWSRVR